MDSAAPRYTYLMCSDSAPVQSARRDQRIPYRDIVKVDALANRRWVWHSYGVVGEPLFIPRLPLPSPPPSASSSRGGSALSSRHNSPVMSSMPSSESKAPSSSLSSATSPLDEDDGWVYVQVYLPETHTTDIVILDARNIQSGPICRIKLKHHIPYGFHACYTPFAPSWLAGNGSNGRTSSSSSLGSMMTPHPLTPLVLPSMATSHGDHSTAAAPLGHMRRSQSPATPASGCVLM